MSEPSVYENNAHSLTKVKCFRFLWYILALNVLVVYKLSPNQCGLRHSHCLANFAQSITKAQIMSQHETNICNAASNLNKYNTENQCPHTAKC